MKMPLVVVAVVVSQNDVNVVAVTAAVVTFFCYYLWIK